jgi:hypothetical protein
LARPGHCPELFKKELQVSEEKVEELLEEGAEAPDIASELQELGRQLAAATKAVLAGPEAQELKVQLRRGLESLEKSVNKVAAQARETTVGQKVESGVSGATATLKERRVLETMAESVATALRTVNKSLGQAVEKAQARAEEAEKSAPQQIEIVGPEEEAPAEAGEGEE